MKKYNVVAIYGESTGNCKDTALEGSISLLIIHLFDCADQIVCFTL